MTPSNSWWRGRRPLAAAACLAIATLAGLPLGGCTTTAPGDHPMTREEVVSLAASGASSATIGNVARNRGLGFPLTVDNILWLKGQNVSDPSVDALLQAEGELAAERERRRIPVSVGLGFGYYGHSYRHHHGHRGWWW